MGRRTALTITSILLFTSIAAAQGRMRRFGETTNPADGGSKEIRLRERGLAFPYGVERFHVTHIGDSVQDIGWGYATGTDEGSFETVIVRSPNKVPRNGSNSTTWLRIEDTSDAADLNGFTSRVLGSPGTWDYSWTFNVRVETAPAAGAVEWPTLAIQHDGNASWQDIWGVELTDTGANLFLTDFGGRADSAPLFSYDFPTDVGDWVEIRMVVDISRLQLHGYVNGDLAAELKINPHFKGLALDRQRLIYDASGIGNAGTVLLDDVVIQYIHGSCDEDLTVDFETEDDGNALVEGQSVDNPPGTEFGDKLIIGSSGPNAGSSIFDSTNPPFNQDPDLAVGTGNILILQNDVAVNPNDDEDGGSFTFTFARPHQSLSIDLIDVDAAGNEFMIVTLNSASGSRTYTVPANWTGDINDATGPGIRTLDLQDTTPQQGNLGVFATSVDSGTYDPNATTSIEIELGGSGGVDNYIALIPCVNIAFELEDDGLTPIVNGQVLDPEFGIEIDITTTAGDNGGATAFDSNPAGPNLGGPDPDLLVGLGNIMILQRDESGMLVGGVWTIPNDDQDGGTVEITFPAPNGEVNPHQIDVIDMDEETDDPPITITLEDASANTRTYTVHNGFTEDLLANGPPAVRTVDLTDPTGPQVGFSANTDVSGAGLVQDEVTKITLTWIDSGGVDNLCFCPHGIDLE
jgi:hypothetical protein